MPVSSLSSAILSHMRSVNSVPPPPPRSVPSLKMSKHIDYGELNALCHMSGLQSSRSALNILSAHNKFIKQYPKIFLQKKTRLPKLSKQEGKRNLSEDTHETQPQQSDDDSHNIAVYVKKAHGGHMLYGSKKFEEKLEEFLVILKKLPIHRTLYEHNTVWKMLKTIPDLTSLLTDDHLKTLSKNVISETWVKGSTVVGNDGFYVILKGLARPRTQIYKNLIEENGSTASFVPERFHSFISSDDFKNTVLAEMHMPVCDLMLRPWSTFGTLEVTAQIQSEPKEYSVVTEEDCEILKIPAKNYAKLKLEKTKLEHKQIIKLIRKCPYYEEWPTLSIYELVLLVKWKRFPPGHVIVESGNIISFVAYINSGHCNIYRNIVGFMKLQSRKVKKIQKLVYMGQLKKQESFGEISVLLQDPFPCTVITGDEVEMAVIEDKDLFENKNSGFVSNGLCLYPAGKKPMAFHHWMLPGQLILALVLCAWEPDLESWLLSSLTESPTAMLHLQSTAHVNDAGPLTSPPFLLAWRWFLRIFG
ncbi:cyclic nucleotide-binding domain-containing protein 1 [Pteronotus mesoamericanus]|uniref:cyclic nucleotide-binding domain-containing protein 1 n=1 Tax=Pteronotus mesoamericanus TaxID=1884717 RepID=UPI0023EAFA50|nr:cyclic nucleotide-binding domain-containing protein 1 [Pteronotus parnellii mesoamericanus]